MSLKAKITEDVKSAMKAKESQRLSALRMLTAAIKQREVDERIELDDAAVLAVIDKMLKQRRESIAQYQKAGRQDLVDAETYELNLLSAYLPKQLSEAEINAEIAQVLAEISAGGAPSAKDMGRIMAALKPRLAGRADMSKVSAGVRARLAG